MGITHLCENAHFAYRILQYTCFNSIALATLAHMINVYETWINAETILTITCCWCKIIVVLWMTPIPPLYYWYYSSTLIAIRHSIYRSCLRKLITIERQANYWLHSVLYFMKNSLHKMFMFVPKHFRYI